MPKVHLRQPGFVSSACEPFPKNKERTINKSKETEDSQYIYQNELDKTCFEHDMTFGDLKDFPRGTASDNILRDKSFNGNIGYGYQRGLILVVYKFFNKKSSGGAVTRARSEKVVARGKSAIKTMLNWHLALNYVKLTLSKRITQTNY